MRARFDRALAVVLDLAAPENGLAFFVGCLQFEPNIEGIYGAAGKKVADFAGSHDDVQAKIIASADGSVGAVDGRRDLANVARGAFRQRGFGFFANRKGARQFLLAKLVADRSSRCLALRRNGKNVYAELLVPEEFPGEFELCPIFVG